MGDGHGRGRGVALTVSVLLAGVTGYVDAVGFASVLGVFSANQSGNMIFLGMSLGGHGPTAGWRTATAIVSFAVGIAVGFLIGRRLGGRWRGPVLLGTELLMLLVVIVIAGPIVVGHLEHGFVGFTLIALTSIAMGLQTESIRHAAGVAVATTYETGALVRIGELICAPFRPGQEARSGKHLVVLSSIIVAYLAGAAIGASSLGRWRWSLLVPCAVLALLVAVWVVRGDWFTAIEDDARGVSRPDEPTLAISLARTCS